MNLNSKITIIKWDITKQDTDAIVNAANKTLLWWWGVDWAIHWAGWSEIMDECEKIRQTTYIDWLPTADTVITTWWNLPANHVIHTVWPIFYEYKDDYWKQDLADCYTNCLHCAVENNISSISFPSISTWVFRCPIEDCSTIAIKTTQEFFKKNNSIKEVRFVLFSDEDYNLYKNTTESLI